jgi:transposase
VLRPMPIEPVPPETARVARAALKGDRYLRVADELDALFTEEAFGALWPTHGQPACPPWRLALATILPCAEGLSDRRAAHAVRSRIDWQDVRRLELTDPGFDASVRSECRTSLITGAAEPLLLETWLTWCRDRQLINVRGRQRTDSTPILAAVRALNRLEGVGETVRHALNSLALGAPERLRVVSPPAWRGRYARRAEDDRLPTTRAARTALTLIVESQTHYGVDRLGPTRLDSHWQARAGAGFDAQHFPIDWDRHHATCPAGKTSTGWTPAMDHRGNPVMQGQCSTRDGRRCDLMAHGMRSTKRAPRRTRTIRPRPPYQALRAGRPRDATAAFQADDARRAGIDGTTARGTRSARLRRTRPIGLARVRRGHMLTAVGLNVLRLGEWFLETPRAQTRVTPFARLMADASVA